jgi:hypothetical protein
MYLRPQPDVLISSGWCPGQRHGTRLDCGTAPMQSHRTRLAGRRRRLEWTIPSVIVTAKKPSKVAAERRYAKIMQKPDTEER